MGEKRTKKTLDDGFTELEQEHQRKQEAAGVEEPTSFLGQMAFICTDIWKAYLTVIAKMLRRHQELMLNWFRAKKQFNSGIVGGLNLQWGLTARKASGFGPFSATPDGKHSISLVTYPSLS